MNDLGEIGLEMGSGFRYIHWVLLFLLLLHLIAVIFLFNFIMDIYYIRI